MFRSGNSYPTKKGQSSALKRALRRFRNGLRGCKRSYPNDLVYLQMTELWVEKWECQIEESTKKKRKSKNTCLETIPEEQEYDEDINKAMVYYPIEYEDLRADCLVFGDKSLPLRHGDSQLSSKSHILF